MLRKPLRYFWIGAVLLIPWFGSAGSLSDSLELTLNQAISVALEQHSDVRKGALDLQLAELELEAAWARATIPSVELQIKPPHLAFDGFSGELQGSLAFGLSLPWGTDSQLSGSLGVAWDSLNGRWQLPDWAIVFSQKLDFSRLDAGSEELETKQQAVEDEQLALEKTRNAVVLEIMEAYTNLLTEEARLDQAERDLDQAQATMTQAEELVEEGLKGETSLLEARLDVLDAQIAFDERQSSYATQKESFVRAMLGINEEVELVPLELPVERLKTAAIELLNQEDFVTTAIFQASDVQKAQRRVEEAKETLQTTRLAVLPDLRFEAGLDEQGLRVGWTIAFDLFSPDRRQAIDIAETNLALAEAQIEAARKQVKDRILNQQATLRQAINNLERLPLEQEKWMLEKKVKQAKYEAGTLSAEDWKAFQEDKEAFDVTADDRVASLLLSYLAYRDIFGMDLDWEDWLR